MRTFTLLILFITVLCACNSTSTRKNSLNITNIEAIKEFTQDKSCNASYQCKVLNIGERLACGGPSKQLVYSVKNVDEARAQAYAKQLTEVEKIANEGLKNAQMCKQVPSIQALCINQVCTAISDI